MSDKGRTRHIFLTLLSSDDEKRPPAAEIMRTSLRIGLATCLLLTFIWITSEIRGLNSRWMPIDDVDLSPNKLTFEEIKGEGGDDGLVDVGPSVKDPITTEVLPGITKSTGVPTPWTPTTYDSTDSPEIKVLVIGKLKSQSTGWVEKGLPEYVGNFLPFTFYLLPFYPFTLLPLEHGAYSFSLSWQHAIYILDDRSSRFHTSSKKINEANAFLTYIIDHYSSLPSTIAFIHPNRIPKPPSKGFKSSKKPEGPGLDSVASLNKLNIDYVQRNGYANLRCVTTPGCPDAIQPGRNHTLQTEIDHTMAKVWGHFFDSQEVPDAIATPCCGQFVVSKQQVMKRPLDDYIMFQEWLEETPLEDSISAQIFEYLWHVIFGQNPVQYVYPSIFLPNLFLHPANASPHYSCPSEDKCMKDLYSIKPKPKPKA